MSSGCKKITGCSSGTYRLVGSSVSHYSFSEIVQLIAVWASARESRYVCIANVHMLIEAHDDSRFAAILEQADLVTPDGMPLVIALRFMYGIRQERVAGMDLLPALLAAAASNSIPVFFYGSTTEVLERIVIRAKTSLPALAVAGSYAPPFRPLSKEEEEADIRRINNSNAGIVLVALGCPKQEHWMARNKGKINAVMVGIGGAFPVYAGLQSRAPEWMQRCALEWLFRLTQEPKRLFKRYLYTNTKFMLLLFKELLDKKDP